MALGSVGKVVIIGLRYVFKRVNIVVRMIKIFSRRETGCWVS